MIDFLKKNAGVASAIQILEAWVESKMAYAGTPGVAMGIVHDQDLIWSRGFGYTDIEDPKPMTTSTIFRIASNSKTFTSIAIMQLRDEGKLQLDDPVEKHLSWFTIKDRFPDAPTITIRHLLTHTSGLPREAAFPYWNDFNFPTREQIMETLPNQETSLPAETQWKYSNLALTIAGEVVAAVSGVPYPDYIHKNILERLGMESTSVILPEEHRDRLATGYGRRFPDGSRGEHPFSDTKGITPAANISSTVEDLAKYISFQFREGPREGRQVLKGTSLREMHRVHWLEPDWKSGWGLGFGVRLFEGKTLVGHGGHVGGYTSQVRFCPEDKIGVIVMSNADDGEPFSIMEQVFRLVAPEIVKAVEKKEEPQHKPEWEKYVGKYRNTYGDSAVLVVNGDLMIVSPQADNPKEAMVKLVPEGEHIFRMECKDGGVEIGEIARFEMTPEGKVDKLWIGDSFTYRIE